MTATFSRSASHLYIASDGAGRHKIGQTINPKQRPYQLGRDIGRAVTIVHTEPLSPDADAIECAAHWILADHHDGGEWFAVSEAGAREALERAKAQVANGDLPTRRLTIQERYGFGAHFGRTIADACEPGETPAEFIRKAIEAELKRRERQKP